jgi:hypothetical protein
MGDAITRVSQLIFVYNISLFFMVAPSVGAIGGGPLATAVRIVELSPFPRGNGCFAIRRPCVTGIVTTPATDQPRQRGVRQRP